MAAARGGRSKGAVTFSYTVRAIRGGTCWAWFVGATGGVVSALDLVVHVNGRLDGSHYGVTDTEAAADAAGAAALVDVAARARVLGFVVTEHTPAEARAAYEAARAAVVSLSEVKAWLASQAGA